MMEGVVGYLISVVAACMLCVPAVILVKKESLQKILRLVSGLLVLLVVVRPLLHLDMEDISQKLEEICRDYSFDTDRIAADSQSQMASYIRSGAETYIEEKGAEMGALIQAEVHLSGGEYPVPVGATLTGTATPEQMATLSEIMEIELEIAREEQEWNLYGVGE